ncbi:Bug family tripartite tricarboxylate transporter substrate binding protein [Caldimonas tepidiphila]|uniref:Bug family tripartite tricarboxylate transporter substrate binding protein n=1 Tax=Caldimonas tepidiphila TaxID=2315841 RepID=UPI001F0BD69C|nr:tripartite tricarboxylate transporter substrate-binding protein [Caldimonas tepidiphila]
MTPNPLRRFARLLLPALLGGAMSAVGAAPAGEAWPQKSVTLVVPFPAGSATDQLARVLGEQLQKELKQPFVIDNKAGANGSIGTAAAAKAAPDGYTLLVATSTTHAANASLYRRLPYDPIKDFAPVSRLAQIPFVMLVNPQLPAAKPQELVALIQKNPGKYSWGSGSSGSLIPGHALVSANKLDMVHVPYKGVPPAIMDTIGNTIQLVFADTANAVPQVKAGKLKALAVTSSREHPMLPGVPPMSTVVPGFEMTAWFALYAPAGTPPEIIQRLNRSVQRALAEPAAREKLAPSGFELGTGSPDELGLFAAKETLKWAKAVKSAGITPE